MVQRSKRRVLLVHAGVLALLTPAWAAYANDVEPNDEERIAEESAAEAKRLGDLLFPAQKGGPRTECLDPNVPLTIEEQRLTRAIGPNPEPVADQLLRRSGFDRFLEPFVKALCTAPNLHVAEKIVTRHGKELWRAAVDRVQGRAPAGGDLPRSDDRPLFWARLQMTRALKQWIPRFALTSEQRAGLEWTLERASRGQLDIHFPHGRHVKRMLVTGFDPFGLDGNAGRDIRNGNPSGAIILALDGTGIFTPSGIVFIETAMFPVRFRDFGLGMVEETVGPAMEDGPRQIDASMTISQGRFGQNDVEATNGRYHTRPDNNLFDPCPQGPKDDVHAPSCLVTPPTEWVPFEAPQWTRTSQPHDAMLAAGTEPFRVLFNTTVTEFVTCTGRETVIRPKGPSLQSCARNGGGGSFLSNEIAYRVTLLRDVFGLDIPAGHLHVPVMTVFAPGNNFEITDAVLEAQRDAIVGQAMDLVGVVAGTISARR